MRQGQAEVVIASQELAMLVVQLQSVTQLQSVGALGTKLQTLISRLESLTQNDPSVTALLLQLQQAGPMPTVGSLVSRIALLNGLLAHLTSTDPWAAQRLARTLPALHALLTALRAAQNRAPLAGWEFSVGNMHISAAPSTFVSSAADGAVGAASVAFTAHGFERLATQAAASTAAARTRSADLTPNLSSAPPDGAPPGTTPLSAGGGAASSSGGIGIGSAAPAIALLAILALWLLDALSARVSVDIVPWRSTLLASRLERPG